VEEDMNKLLLILLGVLLLSFVSVNGLIITPGKLVIDYVPGEQNEYSVSIYNDNNEDIVVEASVDKYAENIVFEKTRIEFSAGETKEVDFQLTTPTLTEFGTTKFMFIRFYQVPLVATQVGATVALLIPIETTVPYPERYLVVNVPDVNVNNPGDPAVLTASVQNQGMSVLQEVKGYFEVSNEAGYYQKIDGDKTLNLMFQNEKVDITANLDTTGMESGSYDLKFTASYDGLEAVSNVAALSIAKKEIGIISIDRTELGSGISNIVNLKVHNYWYEAMIVDVSVNLKQNNEVKKTIPSGSYNIDAFTEDDLMMNLILNDVVAGDYELEAVLVSEEGITFTQSFDVKVIETVSQEIIEAGEAASSESSSSNLWWIVLIIVIVLVLIGVGVYFYIRNKNNEEYGGGDGSY
jgi:flagellar basal body-associated protein FliL